MSTRDGSEDPALVRIETKMDALSALVTVELSHVKSEQARDRAALEKFRYEVDEKLKGKVSNDRFAPIEGLVKMVTTTVVAALVGAVLVTIGLKVTSKAQAEPAARSQPLEGPAAKAMPK